MGPEELARVLVAAAEGRSRFLVAIAGPPGSGKSTLAEQVVGRLKTRGERAVVLPMDGFHMDNGLLEAAGLLARKGAPETFDVRGLKDSLTAVKAGEADVLVPVFDRARELAIAAARRVSCEDRIVVAEGNYLLLQQGAWSGLLSLFDFTVLIRVPMGELERRLTQRWQGFDYESCAVKAKLEGNDLPNARVVLSQSAAPDLEIVWSA
nr:nucleoside triphosphate hydrolase [uncultured Gellertiella sp.]